MIGFNGCPYGPKENLCCSKLTATFVTHCKMAVVDIEEEVWAVNSKEE